MTENANTPGSIMLRPIATATAVVLGMVATAVVAYLLLDIPLLLFMGIVVAAALQPWPPAAPRWRNAASHGKLRRDLVDCTG